MSIAIETSPAAPAAPAADVRQARIAGLCYLLVIAGGLFAEGLARGSLTVPGDAAATARAIADNEALWRWGVAVHLLYLAPALVVNVIVCRLFSGPSPLLARLALVGAVAGVVVEAASLVSLSVPLALAEEPGAFAGMAEPQRAALTYLANRMFSVGFGFALLFFAVFCVLIGVLIVRSGRVPRIIGILMVVAGACYAVNTVVMILSPALSRAINPTILLPILVAELSLAVWLLVKGVCPPAPRTTGAACRAVPRRR